MSDHDTEEFLKGHRVDEASDDLDDYADVVFAENFKLADEVKNLRAQLAQAQERVKVLEGLIEFYKPSFQIVSDATLGELAEGLEARKQLAQRDAEIARLKQSLKRVMSHSPEDRDIDIDDGC